ncbi:MAG: PEP-CTERM sorting domain-containing protein [Pirellulaceae bacterium]
MRLTTTALLILILVNSTSFADLVMSSTDLTSPPTIDGDDAAYLGLGTNSSGNNGHLYSDRPAMGQTFTTGSNPGGYLFSSATYRSGTFGGNSADSPPTFQIQVGTISGSQLTPIVPLIEFMEDSVQQHIRPNRHVTVEFDTPIQLSPNTLYGVDWWGGTSSYGIVLQQASNSAFTGGQAYRSGSAHVGPDNSNLQFLDFDRAFHFDVTAVPEPSSFLLIGLVATVALGRRFLPKLV